MSSYMPPARKRGLRERESTAATTDPKHPDPPNIRSGRNQRPCRFSNSRAFSYISCHAAAARRARSRTFGSDVVRASAWQAFMRAR